MLRVGSNFQSITARRSAVLGLRIVANIRNKGHHLRLRLTVDRMLSSIQKSAVLHQQVQALLLRISSKIRVVSQCKSFKGRNSPSLRPSYCPSCRHHLSPSPSLSPFPSSSSVSLQTPA